MMPLLIVLPCDASRPGSPCQVAADRFAARYPFVVLPAVAAPAAASAPAKYGQFDSATVCSVRIEPPCLFRCSNLAQPSLPHLVIPVGSRATFPLALTCHAQPPLVVVAPPLLQQQQHSSLKLVLPSQRTLAPLPLLLLAQPNAPANVDICRGLGAAAPDGTLPVLSFGETTDETGATVPLESDLCVITSSSCCCCCCCRVLSDSLFLIPPLPLPRPRPRQLLRLHQTSHCHAAVTAY